MMRRIVLLAGLAVCCNAMAIAQQVPTQPSPSNDNNDIVVEGIVDPDEPDATNSRKKVIVGSRIPRFSLQNNPTIAMTTSANGLSPDTGLDPYKGDTRITWTSCRMGGVALSKNVACKLAGAQRFMKDGQLERARAAALEVRDMPDLTLEGRYASQQYLFRIADKMNDSRAKQAALIGMVDTGLMPAEEEATATRSLASAALKSGDRQEALRRFEQAISLDADDMSSRINAALLLQNSGLRDKASGYVRAAISIAQRTGQNVPQAWFDNARNN